jgi:nitroimidazol reductase NimA-like FMN-containing flavoprotein (pyridoxamine 5'-phosphate oxidase superfamily)
MEVEIDEGMETITVAECEQLLDSGGVGVLALCGTPAPILRPVNFAAYQGQVVIRTGEGQILSSAKRSEPASFVVSAFDRFEHTGWSVVVSGKLTEQARLGDDARLPLRPWVRSEKNRFVALSITTLSGRRIASENFADEAS